MSRTLYYGSGSPYAWRVQLALEHKALPYERKVLSFADRDTQKPEFLAMNPRHRVPVLVDGDFTLYESNAIVEYLDDAYPGQGLPLIPGDAKQQAIVRRLILEADNYFANAIDELTTQAFSTKPEDRDPQKIISGTNAVKEEYALWTRYIGGDFLAGPLSAADYALYPFVAFLKRCEIKLPDFDSAALLTPALRDWKARIEALPYFERTVPPHWQKKPQ